MESIIAWLNTPLTEDGTLRMWMPAAAGVIVIVVLLVLFIKKRKKFKNVVKDPVTEKPETLPVIEIANLQGLGKRTEQQDAFGASLLGKYEENGLLAVLCDGMGGMAAGGMIAGQIVNAMLEMFPWEDVDVIPDSINELSAQVYQGFRGHGGTTLVAAHITDGKLLFWCVGDSDLFLLREGKLYALNQRQEYKNDLLLRSLSGAFPVSDAYADPQANALSEYIGKKRIMCDYLRKPFELMAEDTLLLCSDGVSDTLTLTQIKEAMILKPQDGCGKIEQDILAADIPDQDNYTAIVIRYHGKITEGQKYEEEN